MKTILKKQIKIKAFPKWFYLVLVVIPFLFLLILEVSLRAFNYGNDYSVFVKISDQFEDYLFPILNYPQNILNIFEIVQFQMQMQQKILV